jgi:hypothetical protein
MILRNSSFACLVCAGLLSAAPPDADVSRAQASLARLPLRFEENRGQASPEARFLARANGYSLELTAHGPALSIGQRRVDLRLVKSNPSPAVTGEQRMPAATNYLIGNRDRWHTGIANFARVRYSSVYPGIDAVYYGNQNQLEYDFIVAPGADPRAIRLQFAGADRVRITPEGDLSVEANGFPIVQKKPRVYQEGREISARYVLRGRDQAGIELGRYDRSRELVIDPILVYCTYFGTSGNDQVTAMKMGPKGQLYVTGWTTSPDFQYIDGAYNNISAGLTDIFIAIVDTNDSNFPLKYFSYLGGSNADVPLAMAVDGQGVIYLTGTTTSTNFPLAGINVSSTGAANSVDAFVTKIDPRLYGGEALVYSTFLGGAAGNDSGTGIAVDGAGKIYVVGTTKSTDFQVTSSAYAAVLYGSQDAFISKIDPDSDSPLVYSTYMGGELTDEGRAIAVGSNGLIYFACSTTSTQFPIEGASYRQTLQGGVDITIGVIDPNKSGHDAGGSMLYSTYLGGSGVEEVRAITLDANGNLVLTGYTLSTDFPTTQGALSRAPLGNGDVFVTIVNPLAPSQFLVYSTYFGGSQGDVAYDIAAGADGNLTLTGYTLSSDFFTVDAPQPGWGGGTNVFVAKIKPGTAGRAGVLFSTFFGENGQYVGKAVALGADGSIFTAGYGTIGLPSSGNAQGFFAGYDGFLIVVK